VSISFLSATLHIIGKVKLHSEVAQLYFDRVNVIVYARHLIRGDLPSLRQRIVVSEITGLWRYP